MHTRGYTENHLSFLSKVLKCAGKTRRAKGNSMNAASMFLPLPTTKAWKQRRGQPFSQQTRWKWVHVLQNRRSAVKFKKRKEKDLTEETCEDSQGRLGSHACAKMCTPGAFSVAAQHVYGRKPTHRTPIFQSVCHNVISLFKDAERAKAEPNRSAGEGRGETAAFTVSHESLQPTELDVCHASSLLRSFIPFRSVFLSMPGQSHWGRQLAC